MRAKVKFVREKIESGNVAVERINTDNQLADMLTEATAIIGQHQVAISGSNHQQPALLLKL